MHFWLMTEKNVMKEFHLKFFFVLLLNIGRFIDDGDILRDRLSNYFLVFDRIIVCVCVCKIIKSKYLMILKYKLIQSLFSKIQ